MNFNKACRYALRSARLKGNIFPRVYPSIYFCSVELNVAWENRRANVRVDPSDCESLKKMKVSLRLISHQISAFWPNQIGSNIPIGVNWLRVACFLAIIRARRRQNATICPPCLQPVITLERFTCSKSSEPEEMNRDTTTS